MQPEQFRLIRQAVVDELEMDVNAADLDPLTWRPRGSSLTSCLAFLIRLARFPDLEPLCTNSPMRLADRRNLHKHSSSPFAAMKKDESFDVPT